MTLNAQQVAHFQTFGFWVFRDLFGAGELRVLQDEFIRALTTAYQRHPFDGNARHWTLMTGPETPAHQSLLEDPRFPAHR